MKRLIIILLLVFPIALSPYRLIALSPDSPIALSPISTASAATLTPQQKAAKKRAAEKQKAAKKRAAEKQKAAKKRAAAKKKAAKQKEKAKASSPTHRFTSSPNNLIAWGQVGYSALFSTLDQHQTKGGAGGGVGVGYELDYNHWLFLAGVEFTYLTSKTPLPNYSVEKPYIYTPAGTAMTYTHNYSQISYFDQAGILQIPLRFGYRFTDNWYGLIGADFGMGLFSNSKYSYNEYIYARDEQFAEAFHNIGHGTGSMNYDDKASYSLGYTVSPAMEVGYHFNENVRLGLFAEYGFCLTQPAGPAKVHADLLVGARVTARLNLPKRVKPAPKPESEPELQPEAYNLPPEPTHEPDLPPVTYDLPPEPTPEPQPIILENLLFVYDRADIIPESTAALDQLLSQMRDNPDMVILIIGHTDIMGSESYNQRLSEQRAKAVRDYLVKHGIESYRMQYEGRGATEPIDSNDTEEGRQRNRRVEFLIL